MTKAAIEPVWYLPGVAHRFGCQESDRRRILFEHTAGMFPELVTRNDLKVFLPPIGGTTSAKSKRTPVSLPVSLVTVGRS